MFAFVLAGMMSAAVSAADVPGACVGRVDHAIIDMDQLIGRSNAIYLVEGATWRSGAAPTTPSTPAEGENLLEKARQKALEGDRNSAGLPAYLFTVVEILKGPEIAAVAVPGKVPSSQGHLETDFDGHRQDAFWDEDDVGRTPVADDCSVLPAFSDDGRYLVFMGAGHVKAYERIISDEDEWLGYVRERTSGN